MIEPRNFTPDEYLNLTARQHLELSVAYRHDADNFQLDHNEHYAAANRASWHASMAIARLLVVDEARDRQPEHVRRLEDAQRVPGDPDGLFMVDYVDEEPL